MDFNGTNREIHAILNFGAMRVKDGIVDYFERQGKTRPNVDKNYPDVRIRTYLNREDLVISLDLSGEALHLVRLSRGYRQCSFTRNFGGGNCVAFRLGKRHAIG